MPRWIVYGVLGIWIWGALFDLLIASLRAVFRTREYGLPIRSTQSYFWSGIVCLFGCGFLTWLFYWDYLGVWPVVIIGVLLAIPGPAYLFWRTQFSPTAPLEQDPSPPAR